MPTSQAFWSAILLKYESIKLRSNSKKDISKKGYKKTIIDNQETPIQNAYTRSNPFRHHNQLATETAISSHSSKSSRSSPITYVSLRDNLPQRGRHAGFFCLASPVPDTKAKRSVNAVISHKKKFKQIDRN